MWLEAPAGGCGASHKSKHVRWAKNFSELSSQLSGGLNFMPEVQAAIYQAVSPLSNTRSVPEMKSSAAR